MGFVVANFARFLSYLHHKGQPRPIPAEGTLAALLSESGAILRLLAWRMLPSRSGTQLPAPPHLEGRPVLFVHGYWGRAPDFRGLRRVCEERGRPTYAVGLGGVHAPIESWARVLATDVMRLTDRYRDRDGIDIVAHSMGGLVIRRVLMDHPELAARVKTLITLGTPHAGTAHTRGFVVGQNTKQMRRRSPFLATLSPLDRCCPDARVVAIAAQLDAIVYPHESSHLPCAENVELPGLGHTGLLVHRRAVDVVLRALTEGSAP